MSNKRSLSSQQSIDTIIKINPNLRIRILKQFESSKPLKNNDLLEELKKLLEFRNKKIKDQISYLEINTHQLEKIADLLYKLDLFNQLENPSNNLKEKFDKIKEEIIDELFMLPVKFYLEFETNENINPNYEPNNESNYYESNYQPNNESNYESGDQIINQTINKSTNDESDDQIINQTINESTNKKEETYEIFLFIFEYLSIEDLLNCRLVNKKFKEFSDQTNGINKLIIGQPNYHISYDFYWCYNNKSIEANDIISLKCFRTIQKLSIFNLDTNLKYLKIYDKQFKLEKISNLKSLESIEFGNGYKNRNQQILNLNNLKVFVSNYCSVQLDTPKLDKIQFEDINKIKLNSKPESIKHLITRNYVNKLGIFKNLEIMELRGRNQHINENLLSLFKNLKQLKINLSCFNYSNELIKNSLIKILNDKVKLNRVMDIYLEGIKIENIDKFNELVQIGYEYWKFRLNNYDLLDLNLSSINYLYYKELEECVNNIKNDLPSSFFDKFIYINYVYVDSVKDIDGLNSFLNKLKYLNKLVIRSEVSLDEIFYNNLPNTIRVLYIYNEEDINYEFILKLSKLIKFETKVDKDLFDLAFESFLNLKYLDYFQFYYKKERIEIKKNGKYFDLNRTKRELDYNQLIEECKKLIKIKSK